LSRKIVFIAGIHGVGKTTLCDYLSTELSLKYYSASNLIRDYGRIKFPKSKHIVDISGNQDVLIRAINEFLEPDKMSILDGHFCLLDENGDITRIPSTTYKQMKPQAIICLYEDVDVICERLKSRDRYSHDSGLLSTFQGAEISYAREISDSLGVPIFVGKPGEDREKIRDFITNATKGI